MAISIEEYEAQQAQARSAVDGARDSQYLSAQEQEVEAARAAQQSADAADQQERDQLYFAAEEEGRKQKYLARAARTAAKKVIEQSAEKIAGFGAIEALWYNVWEGWPLPILTAYIIIGFFTGNPFFHQLAWWKKLLVIIADILIIGTVVVLLIVIVFLIYEILKYPVCAAKSAGVLSLGGGSLGAGIATAAGMFVACTQ